MQFYLKHDINWFDLTNGITILHIISNDLCIVAPQLFFEWLFQCGLLYF